MIHSPSHARLRRAVALAAVLLAPGCSSVPRGVHEESRQQIVALRAELQQSQNQVAKLKTQNRDVVARAVEDARRIAALEETNERLEQSVIAYQAERDEYARSLREIKQKVLASAGRPQASLGVQGLDRYIAAHPGLVGQSGPDWIALRTGDLFASAEAEEISPRGDAVLDDLATSLGIDPPSDPGVIPAPSGDADSLADRRALRVGRKLGPSRSVSVGEEWVRIDLAQSPPAVPRS